MKRVTKIILFISAIRFFSLWAGEPENVDAARLGIALAYNMQLDEAERIFDSLISRNPDEPQGYVLKSVVYYYRYLLDQSTAEIEKQFIKWRKRELSAPIRGWQEIKKIMKMCFVVVLLGADPEGSTTKAIFMVRFFEFGDFCRASPAASPLLSFC